MAIIIGEQIKSNAVDVNFNPVANIDSKYGPYSSTAAALAALPAWERAIGLTVGIVSDTTITEYWFQGGVTNAHFQQKNTGGGGGTGGTSVVIVEEDGTIEDNTAFLNTNYPTLKVGDKVVDMSSNAVYEKTPTLWLKYSAEVLGSTSPQTGELLSAPVFPYK